MDAEEGGSGTTGAATHVESGSTMASVIFGANISTVAAPKRKQSQWKQS
jgi:transcription termination factor Rho